MKISIIDTLCPRHSLEDKLCCLERVGIEGIELETALWGDPLEKRERVLEALSSSKVGPSTVLFGRQADLQSTSRKIREDTLQRIKQYLDVCAEIGGVGVVTVPSPRRHRISDLLYRRDRKARMALAVEEYTILGKHAEDVGAYVIIEPMDHSRTDLINKCGEAVDICRRTGSEMVRICPDLFHMSIEQSDFAEIQEFSDYIAHLHVGDYRPKSQSAKLPGSGVSDFDRIFRILKSIDFSHFLSLDCEIPDENQLYSCVQFLKQLMAR